MCGRRECLSLLRREKPAHKPASSRTAPVNECALAGVKKHPLSTTHSNKSLTSTLTLLTNTLHSHSTFTLTAHPNSIFSSLPLSPFFPLPTHPLLFLLCLLVFVQWRLEWSVRRVCQRATVHNEQIREEKEGERVIENCEVFKKKKCVMQNN